MLAALTPRRPPPLAGAVHLHPVRVHTPALLPPQVALHGRVIPRILTLGKVGRGRAVDVAAEQNLLLLQLAERQTWGGKERCQSRWGDDIGARAPEDHAPSLGAGRQGGPSHHPRRPREMAAASGPASGLPNSISQDFFWHPAGRAGKGRFHRVPSVHGTPHSPVAAEVGCEGSTGRLLTSRLNTNFLHTLVTWGSLHPSVPNLPSL